MHGGTGLGVGDDGLGVELVGQVDGGGRDGTGGGHIQVLQLRDAVETMLGGEGGDAAHGVHGDCRVLADGGLVGGHGGVGTVEDGVAQSDASARVGTGELTMEPRTSVATMTGLAY